MSAPGSPTRGRSGEGDAGHAGHSLARSSSAPAVRHEEIELDDLPPASPVAVVPSPAPPVEETGPPSSPPPAYDEITPGPDMQEFALLPPITEGDIDELHSPEAGGNGEALPPPPPFSEPGLEEETDVDNPHAAAVRLANSVVHWDPADDGDGDGDSSGIRFRENLSAMRRFLLILFGLGVLAMLILIPLSFGYLEYNSYGLTRTLGGSTKLSRVYGPGRHFLGVGTAFRTFDGSIHIVQAELTAFTRAGLPVDLQVAFQYELKSEEIPDLFRDFNLRYREIVEGVAANSLIELVQGYSVNDLYLRRAQIEQDMLQAISQRVQGLCGDASILSRNNDTDAAPDPMSSICAARDSLHIRVLFLQLLGVSFSPSVSERLFATVAALEEADTATFLKERGVVRAETDVLVSQVRDRAREITASATASAQLVKDKALAEADRLLSEARRRGQLLVYNAAELVTQRQRLAFNLIRDLRRKNTTLDINFNQIIGLDLGGALGG